MEKQDSLYVHTLVGLKLPFLHGHRGPSKARETTPALTLEATATNSLLEELAEGGGEPLLVHVLDADGGHRGADEVGLEKKTIRGHAEVKRRSFFKVEPGPVAGGPLRGRQEKERSKQLKKHTTNFQQKRGSAATEEKLFFLKKLFLLFFNQKH